MILDLNIIRGLKTNWTFPIVIFTTLFTQVLIIMFGGKVFGVSKQLDYSGWLMSVLLPIFTIPLGYATRRFPLRLPRFLDSEVKLTESLLQARDNERTDRFNPRSTLKQAVKAVIMQNLVVKAFTSSGSYENSLRRRAPLKSSYSNLSNARPVELRQVSSIASLLRDVDSTSSITQMPETHWGQVVYSARLIAKRISKRKAREDKSALQIVNPRNMQSARQNLARKSNGKLNYW